MQRVAGVEGTFAGRESVFDRERMAAIKVLEDADIRQWKERATFEGRTPVDERADWASTGVAEGAIIRRETERAAFEGRTPVLDRDRMAAIKVLEDADVRQWKERAAFEGRTPVDERAYWASTGIAEGAAIRQEAERAAFEGRTPILDRVKREFVGAVEGDIAGLAVKAGHAPRDTLIGFGRGISGTVRAVKGGIDKAAAPALERGGEAFGTIAGGVAASGLKEVGSLMDEGKREYATPPGYQKVYQWDTGKYKTVPIAQRPMQPFYPQLGLFDSPGVYVKPEEYLVGKESMGGGFYGMSGKEATSAFEERAAKVSRDYGGRSAYIPKVGGVPRAVSSALKQKAQYDSDRAKYGDLNPSVVRQQAALQSKAGYLDRTVQPGSREEAMIRNYGVDRV